MSVYKKLSQESIILISYMCVYVCLYTCVLVCTCTNRFIREFLEIYIYEQSFEDSRLLASVESICKILPAEASALSRKISRPFDRSNCRSGAQWNELRMSTLLYDGTLFVMNHLSQIVHTAWKRFCNKSKTKSTRRFVFEA